MNHPLDSTTGGGAVDLSGIILRTGKNTKTGIGQKKKARVSWNFERTPYKPKKGFKPRFSKEPRKPRTPLKKQSKRTKWIESLRPSIRIALHRIYNALGYPPHLSSCTQPFPQYKIWDLDEWRGRHTMGAIPATLDPREIQLIRRCCHEVKTDAGHFDYRTEKIKKALWESHDLLVNLLPQRSGSNPYVKEDLSKAIREWARRVMEDARYQGNGTTLEG